MYGDEYKTRKKKVEKQRVVRVRVTGRVQSVGYRAWVVKEANARHLSGWVRNRNDESVEAVFCGKESEVESMVQACHVGPPACRVTKVRMFPNLDNPAQGAFMILPTL